MRWVAGGLPTSGGYDGQEITENGVTYTWTNGEWVVTVEEVVVTSPGQSDPTPQDEYTWDDFLSDQAANDFLYDVSYTPVGLVRDALAKIANKLDDMAANLKFINGQLMVYDKDGDGDRDLTDLAKILDDDNDAHTRELIRNTLEGTPNSSSWYNNDFMLLYRASNEATLEAFVKPLAQWVDALQYDPNTPPPDLRGPV